MSEFLLQRVETCRAAFMWSICPYAAPSHLESHNSVSRFRIFRVFFYYGIKRFWQLFEFAVWIRGQDWVQSSKHLFLLQSRCSGKQTLNCKTSLFSQATIFTCMCFQRGVRPIYPSTTVDNQNPYPSLNECRYTVTCWSVKTTSQCVFLCWTDTKIKIEWKVLTIRPQVLGGIWSSHV